MRTRFQDRRRGIALIVVFVMIMLVSLAAYRFSFAMQSEYRLAKLYEEQQLAREAARGGIEQACMLIDAPPSARIDLVSSQESRSDSDESPFRGMMKSMEFIESGTGIGTPRWRFVLISPRTNSENKTDGSGDRSGNSRVSTGRTDLDTDANSWRWGFENESAKIPINALREWERAKPGHARQVLARIPGMTPETIDPWLMQAGVLVPSLASRLSDSPFGTATSDDRSLFSSQWLGGDLNQNYQIETMEQLWLEKRNRSSTSSPRAASPDLSPTPVAMQRYFTKVSAHRNERFDGTPRIDINSQDLIALHRDLMAIWPQNLADFVVAMRQYGPPRPPGRRSPATQGGAASPASETVWSPNWSVPARYQIRSLLDLVNATIVIPGPVGASPSQTKRISSPFVSGIGANSNYLVNLFDVCSIDRSPFYSGRIDIMDAPWEVLMAIPSMDDSIASRILSTRSDDSIRIQSNGTIAWLLQQNIVTVEKARELEPFICARSDVYSVQVMGYLDDRSPVFRCTLTIDGCQRPSRPLETKTWHAWDAGFNLASFDRNQK